MPFDALDGEFGPVIPSVNLPLTALIQQVRAFMRDHAELNRLITGQEHSDRLIAWAIVDTLDDFNTTPPLTCYTLVNFPAPSLLRRGVVIYLLESIGLLTTRNHLPFSDGGIQVASDKTALLQSWVSLFSNKYEQKKRDLKIALNIEGGWGGGVSSEYKWLSSGIWGGY